MSEFTDRFGRKERTGMGGRSRSKNEPSPERESVRQRLLNELSELREQQVSLQRYRDEPISTSGAVFDPNLFGDNAAKSSDESWTNLRDGDKDAIEALFASDDFAEMFNAGAGHVSRLQPLSQPPRTEQRQNARAQQTAPVCHLCLKRLAPSDIAAYVSKSFDPTKPSRRRQPK